MGLLTELEEADERDDAAGLKPTLVFEVLLRVEPFVPLVARPDEMTQCTRVLLGPTGCSARIALKERWRSLAKPTLRSAVSR